MKYLISTQNLYGLTKMSDSMWNNEEREGIIMHGLELYFQKRRKTKFNDEIQPAKRTKYVESTSSEYGLEQCERCHK